jgi:uncharacterized protein YndB with AHSA1/START domain
MKKLIVTLLLMTTIAAHAQMGKASTEKKTFNRTTTITQLINADASIIWTLLTTSSDYSRWNSTVVSIEGNIELGEKIKLKSTLDTSRIFKLKVKQFEVSKLLVWGDALGERSYILKSVDGGIEITMAEKIGGFMFPLFANKIPSFDASFEQFIADLKQEAEGIERGK